MPARRSTSGLEAGDTQGQLTSSAAAGALKVSGQGGRANRKVQPSKGWLPTLLEPGKFHTLGLASMLLTTCMCTAWALLLE
jgi:hypothetical protein